MIETWHPPACPTCDGLRVAAELQTGKPESQPIRLRRPTRRGWGTHEVSAVRALACTGCGAVTLQVSDLARLREDVEQNRDLYRWE